MEEEHETHVTILNSRIKSGNASPNQPYLSKSYKSKIIERISLMPDHYKATDKYQN